MTEGNDQLTGSSGYLLRDFRGSSWKLLASVINTHTKELLTALYLGMLILIFLSYLIYQIEHVEKLSEHGGNGTFEFEDQKVY